MMTISGSYNLATERDDNHWAHSTSHFATDQLPTDASIFNLEGRRALSPLQGFGQM